MERFKYTDFRRDIFQNIAGVLKCDLFDKMTYIYSVIVFFLLAQTIISVRYNYIMLYHIFLTIKERETDILTISVCFLSQILVPIDLTTTPGLSQEISYTTVL